MDPAVVDGVGIGVAPKQQRGIEVRERLLQAAIEEFTEQGVEGSRVERIVASAGTSWGTFFRYFPRKEDVYLVETARQFGSYVRPLYEKALDPQGPPIETSLRSMFGQLMELRHPPRFQAEMISEAIRHPTRLAALIDEGEAPLAALVAHLLMLGQERGEVSSGFPAPVAAMSLTAAVMFSTSRALQTVARGEISATDAHRIHIQSFDLVWNGLGRA